MKKTVTATTVVWVNDDDEVLTEADIVKIAKEMANEDPNYDSWKSNEFGEWLCDRYNACDIFNMSPNARESLRTDFAQAQIEYMKNDFRSREIEVEVEFDI